MRLCDMLYLFYCLNISSPLSPRQSLEMQHYSGLIPYSWLVRPQSSDLHIWDEISTLGPIGNPSSTSFCLQGSRPDLKLLTTVLTKVQLSG